MQRAAETKAASGSQKAATDNPTQAGGDTGGAFDMFAGLTLHPQPAAKPASSAADTKAPAKPEGIQVKMGAFEATTAQVKKLWTTDLQNCIAVIAHEPSRQAAAMTHYNSSGLISGTDITTEDPDKIRAQLVALKHTLLQKLSASRLVRPVPRRSRHGMGLAQRGAAKEVRRARGGGVRSKRAAHRDDGHVRCDDR